ncbi:MAG: element excision factor XisH family protein, partial [Bacteroidota bacterium]
YDPEQAKQILEEEGWTITDDPYRVKFGTKKIEIDLGAEKLIAAEKGTEKIVVEIKSFVSRSAFYELHRAVGQFRAYRRVLQMKEDKHQLFLAMPIDSFDVLFNDDFGRLTIEEEQLKMLLFNPLENKLVKWIK